MKQNGLIDKLRQKFLGEDRFDQDTSKIQLEDIYELGYDNVVLPFLALLTGFCVALLQLGIETSIMCKKRCLHNEEQSNKHESTSEKVNDVIKDINDLLIQNQSELGGLKFLFKMRELSTLRGANQ